MDNSNDTIIASATGAGRSGVAVVRISGGRAAEFCHALSGGKKLLPRVATLATITAGAITDEAILLNFPAPNSYTGEDMCEIHCHGNPLITGGIINYCIGLGARLAEAGEFSKRAFINGKADLTAAEAVADIIKAETEMQLAAAQRIRSGALFGRITELQSSLLDLLAEINAAIDYPEENIEEEAAAAVRKRARRILDGLDALAASYNSGRIINDGVRVAITGAPNVGKSSVLNRILGKDRAIVSDIPGTTRDTVEDRYEYNGVLFYITDTAGIRKKTGKIERLGIERAIAAVESSDIVLAVADHTTDWTEVPSDKPTVYVRNKSDVRPLRTAGMQSAEGGHIIIEASALSGENIQRIKEELYRLSGCAELERDSVVINNWRQYESVCTARECVLRVLDDSGQTSEIIAIDLADAADALGRITGLVGSDEVIDRIFSKFCVGK